MPSRHSVMSVDLDSIEMDGLPRNPRLQWHFLGSSILLCTFIDIDRELRLCRMAGSSEDHKRFSRHSLGS